MTEEQKTPDLDDILGDQGFAMTDDGEINLPPESLKAEEGTPPAGGEEGAPAESHNWEKRYTDLEPEFTRKSQKLAELENETLPAMAAQMERLQGQIDVLTQQGGGTPQVDDDGRVEIPSNFGEVIMQDAEAGAGLIAEIADRVAERRLAPILERVAPVLEDWELETELRTAALAPGREDFFELLPTIRDIIVRSETDLTFDDAYTLAKTFKDVDQLPKGETAPVAATPAAQTGDRISPEEAQQIAARLKPDTSVSGEVQPTPRVAGSVEDAFNMAVEDVLGR
jgi:uncharacterized coiled-coil protein SlyX